MDCFSKPRAGVDDTPPSAVTRHDPSSDIERALELCVKCSSEGKKCMEMQSLGIFIKGQFHENVNFSLKKMSF